MLLEKHGVLHIVWLFLVLLDTCMVVRDGLFTPTISVFLCHAWTRVVHVPRTPCPANLDHSEDIFEEDAKVWMPYSLLRENPRSDWYYPWQPEEGPWGRRWHELLLRALDEALEKVKSELILLVVFVWAHFVNLGRCRGLAHRIAWIFGSEWVIAIFRGATP